jgi:hypothetical protein
MFQAVRYFESDSLNLALNGDGNNLGFLQIVEDYSGTKAGNLANYYAGVIYLKQGNFRWPFFTWKISVQMIYWFKPVHTA